MTPSSEYPEYQKLSVEQRYRIQPALVGLGFDFFKLLATLSTGSLVLLVGMVEPGSFPEGAEMDRGLMTRVSWVAGLLTLSTILSVTNIGVYLAKIELYGEPSPISGCLPSF